MNHLQREVAGATSDLTSHIDWYETQRFGLGRRFLDSVDATVATIVDWPESGTPALGTRHDPQPRSRRVHGFPVSIIYVPIDDGILILAYAHDRRRPGYWTDRLDP